MDLASETSGVRTAGNDPTTRSRVALLLPALGMVSVTALSISYSFLCARAGIAPLDGVDVLWGSCVGLLIVWWVRNDFEQSRYWPCFDYSTFMSAWWPVLLPHYLVRTRGAKGLIIFAGLLGLLLLTVVGVGVAGVAMGL